MRSAELVRKTRETNISVSITVDGTGRSEIATGVGFFDHMLTHLAKHGGFDLTVKAEGDLHIDPHHTVEDVGICLGKVFLESLGALEGITRYGHAVTPMDEVMAEAAVDISGRPFLHYDAAVPGERVGEFDVALAEEFLRAFAVNARITLHVVLRHGTNAHHCIEGIFKAVARALRQATAMDPRQKGVPSTKGMLET